MENFKIDITGKKFGKLTVLDYSHIKKGHGSYWNCLCECGNKKTVRIDGLRSGHIQSCGCLQKAWCAKGLAFKSHGMSNTPIYRVWQCMKTRCYCKKNKDYKHYGGRGIIVCERWHKFENFYKDMGDIPGPKFTIERIDNNKDYFPPNCEWIPFKKQNRNKRTNINITYQGVTLCLKAWSEVLGINYWKLYSRIKKLGWSIDRAFYDKNV